MPEDLFINFEFGNQFNFGGENGEHIEPEFLRKSIDYKKLIAFLTLRGVFPYSASEFESDLDQPSGSHGQFPQNPWRSKLDNVPQVKIRQEEVRLRIQASLNTKPGLVDTEDTFKFSMVINPKAKSEYYKIKIPYADIESPRYDADYAFILYSSDFHHLYYILHQIHHNTAQIEPFIAERFHEAFRKYRGQPDALDFLYEQAPLWVIAKYEKEDVFEDLKTLLKESVNEVGTNEEFAVLNIIKSFATPPYFKHKPLDQAAFVIDEKGGYLLEKALTEKVGQASVFQRLYEVMNDYGGNDNFSAFIQLFYLFWLQSDYPTMQFEAGLDHDQVILDYRSNKIAGFYHDNMDFEFDGNFIQVKLNQRKLVESPRFRGEDRVVTITTDLDRAHLFQPINVPNVNQAGEIKFLSNVVPAFYLKAFDDKNAYANLEKAIWLTIDIVTTFTGVGNLLKLRHLAKVAGLFNYIRLGIAGIEVASGAVGIMLNFVDECDDPNDDFFCNKLRTFLIFVDLATLGVDALAKKFLHKSAQEALDSMPTEFRNKHPEVQQELEKVAKESKYLDNPRSVDELVLSVEPKYREALRADLETSEELRQAFEVRPELVDAWNILNNSAIDKSVRKNISNLEITNRWLNEGLDGNKMTKAFAEAKEAQKLMNDLADSKSIYHAQVHIRDFDNIVGVTKGTYIENGLKAGKSNSNWNNPNLDLPLDEAQNFVNAVSDELPAGTRLYRVTGGYAAGGYWTLSRPNSVGDVLGGTAVRPEWNSFERIYVYEVPPGEKLQVWRGQTARQQITDDAFEYYLEGGLEQIFIPRSIRDDSFKKQIRQIDLPW